MSLNTASGQSTRSLSNMSSATGSLILTSSSKLNEFSSHSSSLSDSRASPCEQLTATTTISSSVPSSKPRKTSTSKIIFQKNKKSKITDDPNASKLASNVIELNPKVNLILSTTPTNSISTRNMTPLAAELFAKKSSAGHNKFYFNPALKLNSINTTDNL